MKTPVIKFRLSYRPAALVLACCCAAASGCTGEESAGEGDLQLSVSGGAALRDGFPYTEGDATFAFADGWALTFSKYILAVGQVELTDPATGQKVSGWEGPAVMDLKKDASGSLDLVMLEGVPALRYELSFDLTAVTAAADNRNVDQADLELMIQSGWSVLLAGEAQRSGEPAVRFRFGLPIPTHYHKCVNGKDKTQGIAIEASKTTGAFIYAHAVHLFWDTLGTGDEDLRFDAFAAMKGDDDLVTEEELKAQDLNKLVDENGDPLTDGSGKSIFYNDMGKLVAGQQTLYHFIIEAMRASAHFNGIGLCKVKDI